MLAYNYETQIASSIAAAGKLQLERGQLAAAFAANSSWHCRSAAPTPRPLSL